jgi:excisionase family DNA binding protein
LARPTGFEPVAFGFVGREDQPGRRASPLGILEKTRSWVVEAVHASLHRATQLHVSLDAFWTRFHRTAIPKAAQYEQFARRSGPVLGLVLDTGGRRWPSVQTSEGRHSNRQAHQQNGSEASGPVSDASSHERPSIPEPYSAPGGIMDTLDRSRRAAISAARDAARRARDLAEGLEALARALDMMAVELPAAGSPDAGVGDRPARDGGLWTTTEVARYLKTSRSWVYQATAAGRLPSVRVGHLRRFDPAKIRAWAMANASGSVST